MDNNDKNKSISPGQRLKAQRDKLNLTAQDIADRSYLNIKIIEAIEADDYANILGSIYIKGYLRSYAKIVEANVEEIIALYEYDSPPPPEILPEVKQPTQASSQDKPVKVITYLVSLGLVLLLLMWYQSHFIVQEEHPQTAPLERQNMINNVDVSYDIVVHPTVWQRPKESGALPTAMQDDLSQLETNNLGNETDTIEADEVEHSSALSVGSGLDTIVLTLNANSWIEIVDANGQNIFYDLGLANKRYTIMGTAPFNVKLGFSEGVTVKFNGEFFEQSSYSNNGLARFTLPKQ